MMTKSKKFKTRRIRICPRCHTPIITDFSIVWGEYRCKNCKFRGPLFPEIEIKSENDLKKLAKLAKKKNC